MGRIKNDLIGLGEAGDVGSPPEEDWTPDSGDEDCLIHDTGADDAVTSPTPPF